MSTEPFIGEVKWLAFNFAPRGYMFCSGQQVSIAEYTALFALIGTTYGGDGQQTFKLPDLQGRVPIGQGDAPGLGSYTVGEAAGAPTATMTTSNIPSHLHTLFSARGSIAANNSAANSGTAANSFFGTNNTDSLYAENAMPGQYFSPLAVQVTGTTDPTGTGTPFSIVNPYQVLNYSIAMEGIFPSRN
ncbi:MAG: tail fiber protein [Bacteroidia bacterium]|jgi:microcystin-dependent protein|nr:tail fiber protein [Bacteroidia bacterium]